MTQGQGMRAEDVMSILLSKIKSASSGIKSHSVEGLTLTIVFEDDTTETITFEEPSAADVATAMLNKFTFIVDTSDGHLKLMIEEE